MYEVQPEYCSYILVVVLVALISGCLLRTQHGIRSLLSIWMYHCDHVFNADLEEESSRAAYEKKKLLEKGRERSKVFRSAYGVDTTDALIPGSLCVYACFLRPLHVTLITDQVTSLLLP